MQKGYFGKRSHIKLGALVLSGLFYSATASAGGGAAGDRAALDGSRVARRRRRARRPTPGLVQRYFEGAVVFENTHGGSWLL